MRILIVDFGGQYTHPIRRRVHELGVRADVLSYTAVPSDCPSDVCGVILSGSPASVHQRAVDCVQSILGWSTPMLGICFGHQVLAQVCGGVVAKQTSREYGRAILCLVRSSDLTHGLPSKSHVWVSHGDSVSALPPSGWRVIGTTGDGPHAAVANEERRLYGVQFHPEVTHTEYGEQMLRNFVLDICGASQDARPDALTDELVAAVQREVPQGHLLVACSLGVDSTTTALLCTKALGPERVHPVFVNNGLQRAEDLQFAQDAHDILPNLIIEDAEAAFISALEGVGHSEEKRWIVGKMFWKVFGDVARRLSAHTPVVAFSQGTIAPDVIESGRESSHAAVIKTHHNLVRPPDNFPFKPFEPLRTLYKDQVRTLGHALGVPERILAKHPFPGPGLAVRVKGVITPERLRVAREADAIFIRALRDRGYYDAIAQAGATVLQDTAVCVRGDARAEGWIIGLWAVVTEDFMTADVFDFPHDFITEVSGQIANRVEGAGPVVYRTTRKPPATIEWE
jgi:GMP synthase (glutamine-hydrolysing)